MKKLGGLVLTLALSTTILTGCFNNDRDNYISQAQVAYSQGQIEKAYELFKSANALGPIGSNKNDTAAQAVFVEVQKNAYLLFVKTGDNETVKKNFTKAKEYYEKAVAMAPDQVDEALQKKLDDTDILIIEQGKIDKYSAFLNDIIRESNVLLREYNKSLEKAILDPSQTGQFKTEVRVMIPKSSDIMTKMDDAYAAIEEDMSAVHDSLIDLVSTQQDLLTTSLVVQSDEQGNIQEKFQGLQQQVVAIKRTQNSVISQMKQYAETKGVFYDTRKTKIAEPKEQAVPAGNSDSVQAPVTTNGVPSADLTKTETKPSVIPSNTK